MRDHQTTSRMRGLCRSTSVMSAVGLAVILIHAVVFVRTAQSQQVRVSAETAPPPQNEPPVQNEAEDLRGREQRVLRQVIFRDRRAQSALDRAEAALRVSDTSRAVELCQQVFDQPSDHFVWVDRERRLTSARRRASGLLTGADAKTRDLYEWEYADQAKRVLGQAGKSGDPLIYGDVARRFFHTPAGFEATDWLATRWLDRGEYALALKAWNLLATDPRHRQRVNEAIRRKSDAALRLLAQSRGRSSGDRERSLDVRTADLAAGDDGGNTNWDQSRPGVSQIAASFNGLHPARPIDDGGSSRSLIPYMHVAWRMPLAQNHRSTIESAIRRWEVQQQREDKHAVTINSAILVGRDVAFRSYDGICAVDGSTGRPIWKYQSGTSFERAFTEVEHSGSSNGEAGSSSSSSEAVLDAMISTYTGNSILGTLTSDGVRVFAIDSMDIRPRHSTPLSDDPGEPTDGVSRMSRDTNRLIALDMFAPALDRDGTVTPVWSVGGSVGTSNWFYRMDANDDGRITRAEFLGNPDDFRKIDRNGDSFIDRAEAEHPDAVIDKHPLYGHFFLGPPLALDGRLYVVTECDYQLDLVALRADTGDVLWIQGIGYVDRPIDEDSWRSTLACTPSYAGGVIVCPTQVGILVGVDALDGALLWTYYYGDEDVAGPDGSWSFMGHRTFGNAGFPNSPLVAGNRVLMLPKQSEWIHCIDLSNGRGLWKQPRNDAELVAGVVDGVVMIVGERFCRGLSLADGKERWSIRLGEAAGRGLLVGSEYLLPLADNRIVAIDIRSGARRVSSTGEPRDEDCLEPGPDKHEASSGKITELSKPNRHDGTEAEAVHRNQSESGQANDAQATGDARPGNLTAAGSFVYSVGPREIVAYPRAEALLEEVKSRLATHGQTADDLLLAADLELTLGNIASAKFDLAQASSEQLAPALRDKAERLMRAVLYQELADETLEPSRILSDLEKLSRRPRERGRYLQAKLVADVRRQDLDSALDSSQAYAQLSLPLLTPSAVDTTHRLSTRSWLASADDLLRRKFADPALKRAKLRVGAEQRAVLKSADRATLEQFLAVYGNWPESDEVRLRLASLLADAGELQQAELLLIENQRSGRTEASLAATRRLAQLWDRAGFAEEAAELLIDSETPAIAPRLGPPQRSAQNNAALLPEFPADSLTPLAYRRLKESQECVGRVRMRQSLWEHCDDELAETFANASRPFVTRPTSVFQLIDRGTSVRPEINIIDRPSGKIIGMMHVPSGYLGATLATASQVGHFLPLGSKTAFHGISLLQRDDQKPLWTSSPRPLAQDSDPSLVGPSGPTFCVFQSHRHLFVVDPGTGRLLWERTDLDPQSGLGGDPIRGIFGDDEILVVLAADHLDYTAYRTATGEELRQGKLTKDARQTQERRAFGRCLLHFTSDEKEHRMRIWDPLTDRLIYDRAISEKQLWKETGDGEVAVINAAGALEIVDGKSGEVLVTAPLDPADVKNACQLVAFRDAARYYVNVQPIQSPPEPSRYCYYFGTETVLPRIDFRGSTLAIDRRTGEVLWKRVLPQRTLLRTPALRLPVLVMLSLVGDKLNGNHRSMLVEVVDSSTGETLGLEDNKFANANRIIQLTYEHEHRRVRLWGTKAVVDLEFLKPLQEPAAAAASN